MRITDPHAYMHCHAMRLENNNPIFCGARINDGYCQHHSASNIPYQPPQENQPMELGEHGAPPLQLARVEETAAAPPPNDGTNTRHVRQKQSDATGMEGVEHPGRGQSSGTMQVVAPPPAPDVAVHHAGMHVHHEVPQQATEIVLKQVLQALEKIDINHQNLTDEVLYQKREMESMRANHARPQALENADRDERPRAPAEQSPNLRAALDFGANLALSFEEMHRSSVPSNREVGVYQPRFFRDGVPQALPAQTPSAKTVGFSVARLALHEGQDDENQ
jgi:hypothetical protein